MELTDRQKLSIEHLKEAGIETPQEIIKWALLNLTKRRKCAGVKRKIKNGRSHSRKYYQEIIDYYGTT